MNYSWYESKVGRILLVGDESGLSHLLFETGKHFATHGIQSEWKQDARPFVECVRQLEQYFAGDRKRFDLKLNMSGTPFQQRVWEELARIEYGQTISYAELQIESANPALHGPSVRRMARIRFPLLSRATESSVAAVDWRVTAAGCRTRLACCVWKACRFKIPKTPNEQASVVKNNCYSRNDSHADLKVTRRISEGQTKKV